MTDEDMVKYRLGQVEEAVQELRESNSHMSNFMIEVKTWMKIMSAIWTVLVLVVAAGIAKLLFG
jgi:hypothetical protein